MRINGKVVTLQGRDKIIARFSKSLKLGAKVFDKRNRELGKIEWIFGPVDYPYYEIKANTNYIRRLSISEQNIYAEEE